jgi:hypothetical protein
LSLEGSYSTRKGWTHHDKCYDKDYNGSIDTKYIGITRKGLKFTEEESRKCYLGGNA